METGTPSSVELASTAGIDCSPPPSTDADAEMLGVGAERDDVRSVG